MEDQKLRKILFLLTIASCVSFLGGCAHHASAEPDRPPTASGGGEDCQPAQAGVSTFSENRVVEIRLAPRCARQAEQSCEGGKECNTDCIFVTPVHAKLFYNPEYDLKYLENPPRRPSYRPGLARQVQWVVSCYSAQDGSPDASCESDPNVDCVTRACPEELLDAVVIKPTPEDQTAAKSEQMKERWANGKSYSKSRYARKPSISKHSGLFRGVDGERFVIKSPFNRVSSGLPRAPDFEGEPGDLPRRLEWFYDVEVVKDGKVIIRKDPEIWIEEDG